MVLSLILLSVVSLVVGEYEVGQKYNYFYDADSAMTTKTVDSFPQINSHNFSCIASIVCLSANKDGFQFKLELTGIHLIQKDVQGKVINDASGLKVEAMFSNEFVFTILRTGAVGEVKHVASDSEEIVKIKTGIISQFITLGDNETDDEPTETLDNQGMYLSHWKRGKKRERDDVVELTRHYTDEDFIHHLDKNITEDSFILSAIEKKKVRSGVVTESTLEHNLYVAGKEFHRRGRRIGDDTAMRKRMATSNGGNDEFYNGTEVSYASSSSLQHISTVGTKQLPRRVSSSNAASGRSENENVGTQGASSQMKLVAFFNKDFYAEKVELNRTQKAVHLKTSSFASLVKRGKNNFCATQDEEGEGETQEEKDKDKEKQKQKEDTKKAKEEAKKSYMEQFEEAVNKTLDKAKDKLKDKLNDILGDISIDDEGTFSMGGDEEEEEPDFNVYWDVAEFIWEWATVKSKANSENVGKKVKPMKNTRSYQALVEMTREEVFRITSEQKRIEAFDGFSVSEVKDRDWDRRRHNRIHRFTLGGIEDVLKEPEPPKLCKGFEPKNDEDEIDIVDMNWRSPKLFPMPKFHLQPIETEDEDGEGGDEDGNGNSTTGGGSGSKSNSTTGGGSGSKSNSTSGGGKNSTRSSYSRLSESPSSSSSFSVLSPSPFDSFDHHSNGLIQKVDCPLGSGLTLCYQIGGGKGSGNNDFGSWMQGVIYTGSQKLAGLDCKAQGGCNFLADTDNGIYISVMGFNLTIIRLAVCSFRVNDYPGKAYMSFVLFNVELGCHFQDSGCAEFEFVICEVDIPIPNLGYSFTITFMIFELSIKMGLFATFKLAFILEICPSDGAVSASLPPTIGIKFCLEVTLKVLKSKAVLGLTATTELSLIPKVTLSLSLNSIIFSLKLKWVALAISMNIEVKICLVILPCFGGAWNILDYKTPALVWTLYEKYWPLMPGSNDAYGVAVGNETESGIKAEMGKKEDGRSAVSSIGEALDVLLTDTDAGFEQVKGLNTKAEVAEGGDGGNNN